LCPRKDSGGSVVLLFDRDSSSLLRFCLGISPLAFPTPRCKVIRSSSFSHGLDSFLRPVPQTLLFGLPLNLKFLRSSRETPSFPEGSPLLAGSLYALRHEPGSSHPTLPSFEEVSCDDHLLSFISFSLQAAFVNGVRRTLHG